VGIVNVHYTRYVTTTWVDEGLPNLVPHQFVAWYFWVGNESHGPIHSSDSPPNVGGFGKGISWDAKDRQIPNGEVSNPKSDTELIFKELEAMGA